MQLTHDDMDRIRPATQDISETFAKTMGTLRPSLQQKYGLSAEHITVAIARAAMANAAAAWAAAFNLPDHRRHEIVAQLDEVLIRAVE